MMKKYILPIVVAAAFVPQALSASEPGLDSRADSLSYYIGAAQGAYFESSLETMPADDLSRFNKESFIKGVSAAISSMPDSIDVGYVYGLNMGRDMSRRLAEMMSAGVAIDRKILLKAFAEAFMGDNTQAQADSLNRLLMPLYMDVQKAMTEKVNAQERARMEALKAAAAENEKAGSDYIKSLKAKDKKIQTTPSGLSYKILKKGNGERVKDGDDVELIYSGRLIDGTEFDSSKGKPVTFCVNNLISGFGEGLKLMSKGAKYRLYIPSDLGYGLQGAGDKIKPGSMLVFDVEVLGMKPAKVIEEPGD